MKRQRTHKRKSCNDLLLRSYLSFVKFDLIKDAYWKSGLLRFFFKHLIRLKFVSANFVPVCSIFLLMMSNLFCSLFNHDALHFPN